MSSFGTNRQTNGVVVFVCIFFYEDFFFFLLEMRPDDLLLFFLAITQWVPVQSSYMEFVILSFYSL